MMVWKTDEYEIKEIIEQATSPEDSTVRLLVMIITHLLILSDFKSGIRMMKFAINHHWKFTRYYMAFLAGLLQCFIAIYVEACVCFILVFGSPEIFDIIANYVIVLVIVEFQNNFYEIEPVDINKELIENEKYA